MQQLNLTDYKLGFFKNFPNLSFSLKDISVVGIRINLKDDTLAAIQII